MDYSTVKEIKNSNTIDISNFKIILSYEEKIRCLEEILIKLKKILYVYDKSKEKCSNYNYKVYCGGILIYVSSSNMLFEGELVNVIVNLNAIINNDFDKVQIKRLVFETINNLEFLLKKIKEKEKKDIEFSVEGY